MSRSSSNGDPGGSLDQPRDEEGRVVVGDDDAGALRETLQQAPAIVGRWLDVGIVERARPGADRRCRRHAVQHEAVQPIARPGIVDIEGLENDQRLAELDARGDGALQREIPTRPARRYHPVEDVIAGRIEQALTEEANAGDGDRCDRQGGYEIICHPRVSGRRSASPRSAGPRSASPRVCEPQIEVYPPLERRTS